MTKYKQTVNTGEIETWRRASKIILYNEDVPRLEVWDVDRTVLPNGQIIDNYISTMQYSMYNPLEEIPLIDPTTFEQTTQSFSAGQFYTMAASVYLWLAKQRDDPGVVSEPPA